MYGGLLHAHSGLRWLVLVFLIWAIANAFSKKNQTTASKSDKMPVLLGLIFTHLQLDFGFILYFISPKVHFNPGFMKETVTRFYAMEHISLMLIAIVLITIGYSKFKRASSPELGQKAVLFYYGLGLLLILISIPWPFRIAGAAWF